MMKVTKHRFDWANWLLIRRMNREQKLRYAIYAAKSVLRIYEKKYPENKKPRQAIIAAQKVLKADTKENRAAASAASAAAADSAADSAAAYAAASAADAADSAAYAYAAYAAARKELQRKIINYGKKLLHEPMSWPPHAHITERS